MNTSRPYRERLNFDFICNQIQINKGKQFDPDLGELFLKFLKDGSIIQEMIFNNLISSINSAIFNLSFILYSLFFDTISNIIGIMNISDNRPNSIFESSNREIVIVFNINIIAILFL